MLEQGYPPIFREAPGGWTIFDARLVLEEDRPRHRYRWSGKCAPGPIWRAKAENDDGRTLWAEVPADHGPRVAELAVTAMIPKGREIFHRDARKHSR